MAEYARTVYDFSGRFKLNDDVTDPTKYVLVDNQFFLDTVANNVEEEKPSEPGIVDYGVKMGKGTASIPITLYALTDAKMSKLIQDLKESFNPDLLEADPTYGESTDYGGFLPLKWTEDVDGVSRNFQIYLKSMETPQVVQDSIAGLIRRAQLKLKARDPRKYLQSLVTLSGAGVANNVGTYPTPVVITITASGTTSGSLQITNTTTGKSIYVTTPLTTGQVLVIDTFYHSVKLGGVDKRSYVGNNSDWFTLSPGNNTLSIVNGTNAAVGFSFRYAWPL